MEVSMTIAYRSNNSGGSWWLTKEDWKKLETAGWKVEWLDGHWLDAPATRATREGLTEREAIEEWARVLRMDPHEEGCSCCGKPHNFYEVYED
jgi:hypothetical protein